METEIVYNVADVIISETFIVMVTFLCAILLILSLKLIFSRKSYEKRKEIVDLYVIGMIKKFAGEDKVDIDAEAKSLEKEAKKSRAKVADLDNIVESKLNEKILELKEKKAE